MKKYVSLIVCAVITLAALIIPIGSGARFDGKGSGKNQSVKTLDELSNALQGSSATYTLDYSEGINISRQSLNIYRENYQDENDTSYVYVFKDNSLKVRVDNLHSSKLDGEGYGKLSDKVDYVNFVDYNMDTGIVKIKYQTDHYRKKDNEGNAYPEDKWMGEGYSSASALGLDTKEATATISVYADSTLKNKVLDIQSRQIFILEGENDGVKTIKYSQGNGFETGYISSNSFRTVYVSSYFNETQEAIAKGNGDVEEDFGAALYNTEECREVSGDPNRQNTGYIYHGRNYRYYDSKQYTYTNNRGIKNTVIRASVSVNVDGEWVDQYCLSETIDDRVTTSPYERAFTSNYDKGTIKVYQTADAVYAQVNSEMTFAHNLTNTRTTINAEFLLKGNKSLIKINSFFFADDTAQEDKNYAGMEFLTGSRDGSVFGESKIKINQWVNAKDAKIYFDTTTRPEGEFVNPLNFFVDKYFNADGSLKHNTLLSGIVASNVLEQNGKQASLKSTVKQSDICNDLYYAIIGDEFDEFIPTTDYADSIKNSIVDIDFSNKKMPIIKTKFEFTLPNVSVFDLSINSTRTFQSASDRTITIENIGNTVVPKVVMNEVKGLLG